MCYPKKGSLCTFCKVKTKMQEKRQSMFLASVMYGTISLCFMSK